MRTEKEMTARITETLTRGLSVSEVKEREIERCFERYQRQHGFAKKTDSDRSVFLHMYGREPSRSELQTVRFWRLGQHLPKKREDMIALGQALELSQDELQNFLMEQFLLRSQRPPECHVEVLTDLLAEFLSQVTDQRLAKLEIRPGMQGQQKCHIFYCEALDCLQVNEELKKLHYQRHTYSRSYGREFDKYFHPETILSRETVIRVLILLMMPDLDVPVLNKTLTRLGYGPLRGDRPAEGNADRFLIPMLQLCADARTGDRQTDREKMKELLRCYDGLVQQLDIKGAEKSRLRFMKFRSMGNGAEHEPEEAADDRKVRPQNRREG